MRLSHIDSMRGIAILMVVFIHAAVQVQSDLPPWADQMSAYGQMGVQLFFVTSAFTLCYSALQRAGEPLPLTSFAIRRVFRIAPMYYIGIPLYFARSVLKNWSDNHQFEAGAQYTLPNVLANVFFIHGFVPGPANNDIVLGGWSIGTEMAFYLLFPMLFAGLLKFAGTSKMSLRRALLIVAITIVASQAVLWTVRVLTGMTVEQLSFMYFNIANQLPVFVMGMCMFFLVKADAWPVRSRGANVIGFVLFTAAANWVWATIHDFSLIPILAGISFLFLFKVLEGSQALNPAWLRSVGKVSFSMYVLHFFFAYKINRIIGNVVVPKIGPLASLPVLFVTAAASSYLAARVAYALVEARFIELGKRLIRWLRSRFHEVRDPLDTQNDRLHA